MREEKKKFIEGDNRHFFFTIDRPCRQIGVNYTCAYVILDKLSGEKRKKKRRKKKNNQYQARQLPQITQARVIVNRSVTFVDILAVI